MKPKVSLITLGVTDLDRSLRFYRDGLGFATHEYHEGDDHVMFVMDGSWLGLYPLDKLAEGARVPADTGAFSGVVLAHNVSSEAAVDAVIRVAVDAGARSLKAPETAPWGGYESHFADPDGHVWAVAYNPFTDLS